MSACQSNVRSSIPESAICRLYAFIEERKADSKAVGDLEEFEQELDRRMAEVKCEVLGQELERFDLDVPAVVVEGVEHRRVLRCEETYMSAAGPVRVRRTLYRAAGDSKTICPLELRAGIVEGRFTPHAAKLVTWMVAHLTPGEVEDLLGRLGGMTPSRSSLDRLPKQISEQWEKNRESFEQALRQQEAAPADAVTMAVSLDGVMAPMKDGERADKRDQQVEQGKQTRGPAGFKEVGCGTMSFYDKDGDRLLTRRMARMPETHKATLKEMLTDEVQWALVQRPDLKLVKVADGARDNWTYLSEVLPEGEEVVDFYHASTHLNNALVAAYGESHPKRRPQFEKLKAVLRDEPDGADKVIRAIAYLRDKHPRRKKIAAELKYFRRNHDRMHYAELKSASLPIGSGVVEAACKTLVTQRLKRSGMRWRKQGGQAILTFRALAQSDRFDQAWSLLASCYTANANAPNNVIPLCVRQRRAA